MNTNGDLSLTPLRDDRPRSLASRCARWLARAIVATLRGALLVVIVTFKPPVTWALWILSLGGLIVLAFGITQNDPTPIVLGACAALGSTALRLAYERLAARLNWRATGRAY